LTRGDGDESTYKRQPHRARFEVWVELELGERLDWDGGLLPVRKEEGDATEIMYVFNYLL